MIRVPDRGLQVDEAIEGAAGANPVIYGLADRFPVFGVIAGAVIRRQRAANHCDAMGVGTHDHLVESKDEFRGRGAVGNAVQAANVVDALENEQIFCSALRDHIAIEARQRVDAGSIPQNLVAADGFIQYRKFAILWIGLQASRQLIRPSLVGVDGGFCAIGDGIPDGNDRSPHWREQGYRFR